MWSYRKPDGTSENFSEKNVKKLFVAGKLLPNTEVWNPSMSSWQPASETELNKLFPSSQGKAASDAAMSGFAFTDPEPRLKTLRRGLKLYIGGAALSGVTQAASVAVATSELPSDELSLLDVGILASALLFSVGLIWSGIAFMRWTKRVSVNAHAMAQKKLKYSPNFAMWSYLIPVVNLWIPYVAITEIWSVSCDTSQRGETISPKLLGTWWGLFIITGFVDQIVSKLESTEPSVALITAGSFVINICAAVVALRLVTAVTATQTAYAEARGVSS